MNPKKMEPYRKAHQMEVKEKSKFIDALAWLVGEYTMKGTAKVLNNKNPAYPNKPYSLKGQSDDTPETHDYSIDAKKFSQWAEVANADFERKNRK